jgi:hypothetical protein
MSTVSTRARNTDGVETGFQIQIQALDLWESLGEQIYVHCKENYYNGVYTRRLPFSIRDLC